MTPRGQALLETYPPFLQDEPTLRAICNCAGEEFDILDARIEAMERNVVPITTDELVGLLEKQLGLVGRDTMSLEERMQIVLAILPRAALDGQGYSWKRIANLIIDSTWTFEITGPTNNTLTIAIPFAEGSTQSEIIRIIMRSITPAVMSLSIISTDRFLLDRSLLDGDHIS